jgi:protein TonB
MPLNKAEALRHAEQFVARGKVPAAIAVYQKIVESDPLDLTAICALGDLYVSAGQKPDALEHYSTIADSFIKQGAAVKAAYILRKILELDPANPNVQLGLAELYSKEGMIDKAHSAFLEAGSSFARTGKIPEALDANKRALVIKPESHQAREAIIALEAQAAANLAQTTAGGGQPGTQAANIEAPRTPSVEAASGNQSPDFDDRMVIKSISKAELLAGYGDVEQAVTMLKDVLSHRPDSIDVHVKLKDIYLRNEMIVEAEGECVQIASLYDARGDSERARDFTIRANRLSQLIKPTSGPRTTGEPAFGAPPSTLTAVEQIRRSHVTQPALPNPLREPAEPPVRRSASLPADTGAVTHSSPPVVEVAAPPIVESVEHDQSTLRAMLTSVETAPEVPAVVQPEPELFKQFATTAFATLGDTEVGKVSRRRWIIMAAAAVTIAGLSVGAVWLALPMYHARLDKEYAAVASAQAIAEPHPSEPPVVEDPSTPVEQLDVPASETAAADPEAANRNEAERLERLRQLEEARQKKKLEDSRVVPPDSPPVASQPLPGAAANKRSPMAPPSVGAVPASQGGSDGSTPLDVSSVPGGANRPGEAPAPAPRANTPTRAESLRQVRPEYPSMAKASGQKGIVTVEVSINERGDVVSARAISGPSLLRGPAVTAASRWKFKPAMRDGKPISSVTTISFNFRL